MSVKFYGRFFFFLMLLSSSINAQKKTNKEEKMEKISTDTIPEYVKLLDSAIKLIDSTKYKQALPLLKKVVKQKPDNWKAYNKMAYVNIKMEDYKDAEKNLIKSEIILPSNYETLKLKGINFFLNNKFKESKGAFDTAIVIAKEDKIDDTELYVYRAKLMMKGKGYKDAIGSCDEAIYIDAKCLDAYLIKGEAKFNLKEYNYAVKELSEAIKLMKAEKVDYNAYKLRAKAKFELKDFKGAVTDWSVYIDAIPKEEEALVARGAAKININDNSGAISDLDEAIKLNAKNPVSYCYRGVAKGGNKAFVEALKDLDYSIKLKFDYAAAYVNRAAIKMASKDKNGACDDLTKADGLGDEMAVKLIEKYCKDK